MPPRLSTKRSRARTGTMLRRGAALLVVAAFASVAAWLAGGFGPTRQRERAPAASEPPTPAGALTGVPVRQTPPPRGLPVAVRVTGAAGPPVPRAFLGLSFEAASLPSLARYGAGGPLAALMRALGTGVIRVGGLSVDKLAAWAPEGSRLPAWATTAVTPPELAGLAALAKRSGWRVLLDVNVAHYDPEAAAQEVASARALMGESLLGVGLGNEPDRYTLEGLRGAGWGFGAYESAAAHYRAAIARAAPGVPVAAPDASSGPAVLGWVRRTAAALHPAILTDHYYPLTSCGGSHPTVGELLSPAVRSAESALLGRLRAIADAGRAPLLLDESNDISCHGEPGVSDSFASALWAVDWIARAMAAGVGGVSFHDLLAEPHAYSPLVFAGVAGSAAAAGPSPPPLHANPEWYALLLDAPLAGSTPLHASVTGSSALVAHAFLGPATRGGSAAGDGRRRAGAGAATRVLRIVLVDFSAGGGAPLRVRLEVPAGYGRGSLLRLSAPSPSARSGVLLGGAAVNRAGTWAPRTPLPAVHTGPGGPEVEMRPGGAALVTLMRGR
jgi:hypothetical protein